MVVYERIALDYACTYLCPELSPCLGLSTDDGTDVWLKDAQYAVCTGMVFQSVHLLLLMVHLEDGCQGAFLICEQTLVVRLVLCKQVHQDADVFVQVVEHHPDSLTHHPAFLLCFLDKLKIRITCPLVVCAWLVQFKHLAHLHNIVGNLAAAVMYYIKKMVRAREIPYYDKGRKVYFFEDELVKWVEESRVKTWSEEYKKNKRLY